MKVKIVENNDKGFKPITLQLNLETKEEVDYLKAICRFNVSIPSLLRESKEKHKAVFEELLTVLDSIK